MQALFIFLQNYTDLLILGLLGIMSFLAVWFIIERYLFLSKVDVTNYSNIHDLNIDLTRNLTLISTIGVNAPYVGLLGTVIGILLTFYELGNASGNIETTTIMLNLSLALKATAVGILVAIPSMAFYNGLARKVEVNRMKFEALKVESKNEKV